MKKIAFQITVFFLSMIVLSSCGSDDGNDLVITTVTEDKENIQSSVDLFLGCLENFENGDFSTAVKNFFEVSNGEFMTAFGENLIDQLDNFNIDTNNFNFNAHTGTYTWSSTTQSWNFITGTNEMVFFFPSEQNSSSNNLEVAITSYASQTVTFDNQDSLAPTSISGYAKENGTTIFTVDLSNVTYETNDNFSFPSNFNLEIFMAPFTHTFNLSKNTNTQFDFSYDFQDNSGCITSLSSLINLNTSDYQNIVGAADFQDAVGTIRHQDLEVRYSVEIDDIEAIEDPTVLQINQLVDAEVYYNNAKIGDLEYNEDANGDDFVTIIYSDGTSDNVNIYVGNDFVDQLETIFTAFIN